MHVLQLSHGREAGHLGLQSRPHRWSQTRHDSPRAAVIAVLAVRAALGAILGDLSVAGGASASSVPGATGIRSMVLQWRSRSI